MKKNLFAFALAGLLVLLISGCSLIMPDVIVGRWQQVSVGGAPVVLVNVVEFTASTYTGSVGGLTLDTGTWTKSGSTYTLNGAILGFLSTSSTITPTFSNSSNTLSYTDGNVVVEVYNRL
jgi:hypothetical protein